ncbi:hypothetical protein [Nocardioides lacusdianchii]|uniref:hypothetical protein n=1 Tax=Nocardioides lacusdianchii TaxID=2783664 RepID=UPI001CCA0859|nr:hypothetical protein [Nocardioides lacusdianchii]
MNPTASRPAQPASTRPGDLISKRSEQFASFVRYELQAETETPRQAIGHTGHTGETVRALAAKADVKPRLGAQADESSVPTTP